jgi:DmsE family decaheme c-type cytochrome
MRLLPRVEGCGQNARGLDRRYEGGDRNKLRRLLAALAAVGVVCAALSGFATSARANDLGTRDDPVAELRNYVQVAATAQPDSAAAADTNEAPAGSTRSEFKGDAFAALRAFVQQIAAAPSQPTAKQLKVAEADNAFDALREFFQKQNGAAAPEQPKMSAPPAAHPRAPLAGAPVIEATLVGSNVCLGCHTGQAESFSHTLMGRLQKQGKLQCETCHGPGSAHVHAAGCAACHGDGGITTRPGIPSLVGQDPQYLVAAMKDYITGQRKNALMKALLSGLGEAELNNIAVYYARQIPARAQTPPVGDPAAGKPATGLCANCHGAQGVGESAAFPSLAGQDAQYLASAIRAYKDGSRVKAIACATCHGEGGISKTPGIPSLVGQDPQYLVASMKAYASGQRNNAVMKALLSGVSETELNTIALFYAGRTPARAQTPPVGDASAGKAASPLCAGCHGPQGVTVNPVWPSLAGQDAQYLAAALRAYKDGTRDNAAMKPIVATLDERAINDVASYYASLPPSQPRSTGGAAAHEPVLARNGLVSGLDQRTIDNIASYYASLSPAQPAGAKNTPARPAPMLVRAAAPTDGRSAGGIISFRRDDPGRTAEENNRICLGCHERGERTNWAGSVHEERGLACTNCHTVMTNVSAQYQLKTAFQPDTCFQCHKDRRAQMFRAAHMPMREGKIVCSDCHNPHGSATEALLREDSINDNCYKCHAEKRGPFLFEHMPVRENCLNCHDPHGSINEFSLKMPRPRLCFECHTIGHAETTGINSNFTMGRACQNCHTMIHGSNSPNGGALQR